MKLAHYHIQELKIHAYVGVYDFEQEKGNDFSVDISYDAPYEKAAQSDELADSLNYAEICGLVERVFTHKCKLLEQMGTLLVSSLKENFPQMQNLTVIITKLNPPVSQSVKGISIRITG